MLKLVKLFSMRSLHMSDINQVKSLKLFVLWFVFQYLVSIFTNISENSWSLALSKIFHSPDCDVIVEWQDQFLEQLILVWIKLSTFYVRVLVTFICRLWCEKKAALVSSGWADWHTVITSPSSVSLILAFMKVGFPGTLLIKNNYTPPPPPQQTIV